MAGFRLLLRDPVEGFWNQGTNTENPVYDLGGKLGDGCNVMYMSRVHRCNSDPGCRALMGREYETTAMSPISIMVSLVSLFSSPSTSFAQHRQILFGVVIKSVCVIACVRRAAGGHIYV